MDIADEIRDLMKSVKGCNLVAFADISSKMVLLSKSKNPVPQEELDGLCLEAAVAFDGALAKLNETGNPTTAIVANGTGTNVFLRAEPGSNDVLCCMCTTDVDVTALLTAGRATLKKISQDAEQ